MLGGPGRWLTVGPPQQENSSECAALAVAARGKSVSLVLERVLSPTSGAASVELFLGAAVRGSLLAFALVLSTPKWLEATWTAS